MLLTLCLENYVFVLKHNPIFIQYLGFFKLQISTG